MAWICPQCGELNCLDSVIQCTCGFELDDSVIESTKVRLCPDCMEHNYADQDDCKKCGFDFRLNRADPDFELKRDGTGSSRDLPVEFRGSAREYFRIWIVNLCLTLLTAGIFSAWAKVRKKRYFYSHTTLDGTPFQYLGRPVPILKGRVIAATAFSAYYVSSHFFTEMLPYIFLAGAILGPWVIIRSAAFNARYSSFRNMTFHFDGKYSDALKATCAWILIPALLVDIFFKWPGRYAVTAAAFGIFGLLFPWWIRRLKDFIIGHTSFGSKKGDFSATGGQFFKVYLSGGLIFFPVAIVTAIIGSTVFSFLKDSKISFLLTAVPGYVGYVLAYAYIKANGNNLVWDHTRLGGLRFNSTLRSSGLAKLYLTNALVIIASLGLMTPWAVMRTLKYRADNIRVVLEGDLSDFRGTDTGAVQAAGAELGDIFDMDLSL
jgi:uncharacterized membrane protein YjgN (DUF898 family)